MKPLNLQEFAEDMRRKGDLRAEIEHHAKDFSNPDDAAKALEWIGDRSNLLKEIEEELDKDGRTGDTDDQVKALLETLAKIRNIIGAPDTATDEDLEIAIQTLVDAAPPTPEYDL